MTDFLSLYLCVVLSLSLALSPTLLLLHPQRCTTPRSPGLATAAGGTPILTHSNAMCALTAATAGEQQALTPRGTAAAGQGRREAEKSGGGRRGGSGRQE